MTPSTMSLSRRRRMLVLCPYPMGVAAGQRLKYEQYLEDWRAMGFDIDVSPFMNAAMWKIVHKRGHYLAKCIGVLKGHFRRLLDLTRIWRYDVVYVFMWVTPFGTSLFERLTRLLARRLIFDVEDNVLIANNLPSAENPNAIVAFLKGPHKARYLIANADQVITASPFFNETCLEMNQRRRSAYVPPSVDTDRFVPTIGKQDVDVPTIGWTGTFSSKIYLDLLSDMFRKLAQRTPYKLKVIGNFDYELDGVDLEVVQWSKEREAEDLQSLDIGVYPLPFDDWVMGKAGLKAIQYMAIGLPTVATDVGTSSLVITQGVDGLLVKTEDEWIEALEGLLRDPALRRRLGTAAREAIVAKYSTRAVAARYRQVLTDVISEGV